MAGVARGLRYWRPLLTAVVTVPLALYAALSSLVWFAQPFPGFLVMENGVIPTVGGVDWPPDKNRLFHAQVLSVDGEPVRSSAEIYARVGAQPPATRFEYRLRGAQGESAVSIASRAFTLADYAQTYGVLLFFGLIALGSGIVVGFLQPERQAARVYLLQAAITGLYACTAVFLHRPGFPILGKLCLALECLFAASWIHLALVFPVGRQLRGPWRVALAAAYAVSGVLAVSVLIGFAGDPPDTRPLYGAYVYNALALGVFLVALIVGYRDRRDPLPRLRVQAVLIGAIVCLPWPLLVFLENALSGRQIPVQFALLLTPLGYVSLGYAIVKHDLFDVDRIVRRTFAYVLLSVIILSAYALLLQLPARLVPAALAESGQTVLSMAFVLLLALILDPLRRVVQQVVDRAFGRGRLDYRGTIRELSSVLTTLLDLREVVAQVTRVVTDAMQVESAAVCLVDDDNSGTVFQRRNGEEVVRYTGVPGVPELARRLRDEQTAVSSPRMPGDGPASPDIASLRERLQAELWLPLTIQNRPVGFLAFGAKQSGQRFDSETLDLLRTLADQTAIAVQNARSHAELEELNRDLDAQVRLRTAELRSAYDELMSAQAQLVQAEKMASLGQLVAGVAHELNNPASFAYAGLENIEEAMSHLANALRAYEQAPIADPQARAALARVREEEQIDYVLRETPQLLRISAEGLERIRRIVDDLRLFARADSGERRATRVEEGIESSLRLLGHRLSQRPIRAVCHYADLPPIEADPGQLNQVWMNLINNAIDALQDRPDPEIRIDGGLAPDGRGIRLSFSDNGAGIEPVHLPRVFEPFFTTKPIGAGTGLGLSIAFGAVKAHGGTIEVASEVGKGTTVSVFLPCRTAA
jgi:signal transduction histidine kinase